MPTLSVCMIVRNEAKHLERCLKSIKHLADEIVIIDTGSVDDTRGIARKFTNKVINYQWLDDFADARNKSLKHATSDWVLVIDADEVIAQEDCFKIRELLNSDLAGFTLIQRNYVKSLDDYKFGSFEGFNVNQGNLVQNKDDSYAESEGMEAWLPTPIVRLFRREGAEFDGYVHEDVSASLKGKISVSGIPIHHYGKVDIDRWRSKWSMYEELSERKAAKKNDYYADFELGRQYLANQKLDEAQRMFLKSITKKNDFWLAWFNLGSVHLIQNKFELAQTYLLKAKELNPNAISVYKNLGVLFAKKEEYGNAIDQFVLALNLDANQADVFKNMGLCYEEMGNKAYAQLAYQKAIELNPNYEKEFKKN